MGVKYTHLITKPDWDSACHVAIIGGSLHYKVLRTGAVGAFGVSSSSVEELYAGSVSIAVTPLNKFTGNI